MKVNGISGALSSMIARPEKSMKSMMGNKKALYAKSSCCGLNDPCIINGTVGKRLSELISK